MLNWYNQPHEALLMDYTAGPSIKWFRYNGNKKKGTIKKICKISLHRSFFNGFTSSSSSFILLFKLSLILFLEKFKHK